MADNTHLDAAFFPHGAPAGLHLVCTTCRFPFPDDLTVGVLAAHFETEPDHPAQVTVELCPLCRCGAAMTYSHRDRNREVFECTTCRRSRRVPRAAFEDPTAGLP